ncbi:MAG: class I SAM-dependent methyltransferase [Candidatus Eremiobacteraeota bacterium]|nr:class I SAM-dependent methyltransferase [Candidatus Eremiobacteraeota bacterium]
MSSVIASRHDRTTDAAVAVLRALFRETFALDFAIELWDGTRIEAERRERFVLKLRTPYALRAALSQPVDLNLGRAFVEEWIDVGGDLEAAVDAFQEAAQNLPKHAIPLLVARLVGLPRPPRVGVDGASRLRGRRHSPERDAAAIGFHYDQPLAFYASFLDPQLVYSCAYFEDDARSLDEAQMAKIDYVLRKLRLTPGQRLLDIGCGWGALVIRAAERFGAQALGVTLSVPQRDEALRRIGAQNLSERATVELRDYRDLGTRRFDRVVSIGMVEHVGRAKLPEYFAAAYRALRNGGLFLNHGIADQEPARRGYRASGFMERYVFPDGELVPISHTLTAAERAGFEVRDVENLREHYARTLRSWVANLDRNAAAAKAAAGKRAYRVWRLYMTASAQGFRRGRMGLFQALLSKPYRDGSVDVPPTRHDLYA